MDWPCCSTRGWRGADDEGAGSFVYRLTHLSQKLRRASRIICQQWCPAGSLPHAGQVFLPATTLSTVPGRPEKSTQTLIIPCCDRRPVSRLNPTIKNHRSGTEWINRWSVISSSFHSESDATNSWRTPLAISKTRVWLIGNGRSGVQVGPRSTTSREIVLRYLTLPMKQNQTPGSTSRSPMGLVRTSSSGITITKGFRDILDAGAFIASQITSGTVPTLLPIGPRAFPPRWSTSRRPVPRSVRRGPGWRRRRPCRAA